MIPTKESTASQTIRGAGLTTLTISSKASMRALAKNSNKSWKKWKTCPNNMRHRMAPYEHRLKKLTIRFRNSLNNSRNSLNNSRDSLRQCMTRSTNNRHRLKRWMVSLTLCKLTWSQSYLCWRMTSDYVPWKYVTLFDKGQILFFKNLFKIHSIQYFL